MLNYPDGINVQRHRPRLGDDYKRCTISDSQTDLSISTSTSYTSLYNAIDREELENNVIDDAIQQLLARRETPCDIPSVAPDVYTNTISQHGRGTAVYEVVQEGERTSVADPVFEFEFNPNLITYEDIVSTGRDGLNSIRNQGQGPSPLPHYHSLTENLEPTVKEEKIRRTLPS